MYDIAMIITGDGVPQQLPTLIILYSKIDLQKFGVKVISGKKGLRFY